MWVAVKLQTIKRGKGYVQVKPGDPIPEASTWPNLKANERTGFIRWIDDPPPTSPGNRPFQYFEEIPDDITEEKELEKEIKKPRAKAKKK